MIQKEFGVLETIRTQYNRKEKGIIYVKCLMGSLRPDYKIYDSKGHVRNRSLTAPFYRRETGVHNV